MTAAVALVAAAVAAAVSAPLSAPPALPAGEYVSAWHPIQSPGGAPWCLFAVNANLHHLDLWQLAADYNRAGLPNEADGVTPQNGPMLDWLAHIGYETHVYPQWDADAMLADLVAERGPVAASIGRNAPTQHAIVIIAIQDGQLVYLDPATNVGEAWEAAPSYATHSSDFHRMTLEEFWAAQTGWYWRRK